VVHDIFITMKQNCFMVMKQNYEAAGRPMTNAATCPSVMRRDLAILMLQTRKFNR
jgi:hypothetical protein